MIWVSADPSMMEVMADHWLAARFPCFCCVPRKFHVLTLFHLAQVFPKIPVSYFLFQWAVPLFCGICCHHSLQTLEIMVIDARVPRVPSSADVPLEVTSYYSRSRHITRGHVILKETISRIHVNVETVHIFNLYMQRNSSKSTTTEALLLFTMHTSPVK